ncbi:MAG: FtsW/RodA/SpoVE family cell cycle protein [Opitutales bacterium]
MPVLNPEVDRRVAPAAGSLWRRLLDHPLRRFVVQAEEARFDWINPLCMLLLATASVVFIYSAQSYSQDSDWAKQIFWVGLGFSVYAVVSLINYNFWLEYAHWFYLGCLALLFPLVIEAQGLNLPLVKTRFGSTRWIDFGPFSLQPSELAKIGTLLMIASILARSKIGTISESLRVLVYVAIVFSLPIALIFLQPDLGSSLVFPPMVFALLYVSRLSLRFFAVALGLFVVAVSIIAVDVHQYYIYYQDNGLDYLRDSGAYEDSSVVPLHDYQRQRILTFVAPSVADPTGVNTNWNLMQSLIAVAGGGVFGKGVFNGLQATLGYLPSTIAPNDFIFSVAAEETGFIGGVCLIGLLTLMVLNGFRIAGLSRDRFGMLLAVGVSCILMVHVFVNIGMTIGLMPITGLPLPFLSYGGSFFISCCILQGLLQSTYRFRRDFS